MNIKLTSAILGVAAFGAAAAVAGHHEGAGEWEAKLEAKFAKIDVDTDGSVTEAEYLDYKMAEAKQAFLEMGGDDGAVTLDEAKAAYAAQLAEKAAMNEKAAMEEEMMKKESDGE